MEHASMGEEPRQDEDRFASNRAPTQRGRIAVFSHQRRRDSMAISAVFASRSRSLPEFVRHVRSASRLLQHARAPRRSGSRTSGPRRS